MLEAVRTHVVKDLDKVYHRIVYQFKNEKCFNKIMELIKTEPHKNYFILWVCSPKELILGITINECYISEQGFKLLEELINEQLEGE